MTPAYAAYDRRNRKTYLVNSIHWTFGSVLRAYHPDVPDVPWVPEEIVVTLDNGKRRKFSYYPGTTRTASGRRSVTRDIRDITLSLVTQGELREIVP
ncbi:hypothetical protein [Dietzia natronolimnaea]|uniref:hypothetical protein n=1 Tax=Dietzia natronolimnaea TaxID=161920 RepID=UPI0015FC2586|nr:hypothetical protein [Dietzia natronolimnaea]MBB1037362.1 hypothetical protein [Dietzia natronolimnaea]